MKALSIKQPWASLIAHGIKDIENRTWKTHFRGRIYIHASDKSVEQPFCYSRKQLDFLIQNNNNFKYSGISAIIGEVDIIDCVINHPSIWAEKSTPELYDEKGNPVYDKPIYNWVLANPALYDEPILNVKGKLSFWEFENPILLK